MEHPFFLKNARGFVLVTTYLVISLISVFALAYFSRSYSFAQASERNQNKIVAFNTAEAAIDLALAQLATTPSYTGTTGYTSLSTNFIQGGYTVTVSTPTDNPNIRIIQATGFAPDNNPASRAYQTVTVTTYGQIDQGRLFDFAIFADNSIQLTGNASVDSYDSRDGSYGGNNKKNEGDVGTNSTGSGSFSLTGNATIKGDAVVGPNGDPSLVIQTSGNADITGTRSAASELKEYDSPTTSLPTSGSLSLSGNNTLYLSTGTYHYSSIKISGNAKLNLTGSVTIYVDGEIDISGNGIATQNNLPPNLLVYVTGTDDVKISGNANFYGGIYAPKSKIQNSGNGAIFGAVVSKEYKQNGNGNIHFDEALKDVQGNCGSGHVSVSAWQEQNTLAWGTGS